MVETRTTRAKWILRTAADCAERREVLYFVEVGAWIVVGMEMTRAAWSVE